MNAAETESAESIEEARAMNVFYDFIEAPERAARAVQRHPPVVLGVFAFAVAALSFYLANKLSGRMGVLGASLLSFSVVFVWRLGMGVVQTAVIHFVAETVGGRGRAVPLFVMMGLSELAWTVALPGVLLLLVLAPGSTWVLSIVYFAVGTFALVLKARSVRLNYGFSKLKAWFSLLLPPMVVFACIFFFFFAAVIGFIQQVVKAFS